VHVEAVDGRLRFAPKELNPRMTLRLSGLRLLCFWTNHINIRVELNTITNSVNRPDLIRG
jgi:hypothetical protein